MAPTIPTPAFPQGSQELVNIGLKVLDTLVEQVNPEYLQPAMAPIADELMTTLWGHMRPPPYPFGPKVAQLLGKMGGRNRAFVKEPQGVEYRPNPEHSLRMIFTFEPSTSFLLPLDKCVAQATEVLEDTSKQGVWVGVWWVGVVCFMACGWWHAVWL